MDLQGRNLKLHMKGEDVSLLHSELSLLGYDIAAQEIEAALFGSSTHQAVLDFQSPHQLEPTGVVEAKTAEAINEAVGALPWFVVRGTVRLQDDTPVKDAVVRAFDKDLRREELLGEDRTVEQGGYSIRYLADRFARSEKKSADLIVRAYRQDDNVLLAESDVFFNAKRKMRIDLVVQQLPPVRKLSEYEQLLATLAPVLDGLPVAELNEADIAFLLKEFAGDQLVNKRRLNVLAQSARLARQTNLPTEFFYGLAQQLKLKLPLTLDAFLALETPSVRQALVKAIKQNIIPPQDQASINAMLGRFEQLKLEHGSLVRRRVPGCLVNAETGEPLAGYTVRARHQRAGEQPKDLGYDTTDKRGRFAFVIVTLPAPTEEGPNQPGDKLELSILDKERKEIHRAAFQITPDKAEVLEVKVPAQVLPQPISHPIDEVAEAVKLELPEPLLPFLTEHKIHTLEDIRRAGGIGHLENLPVGPDDPAVKTLEAHANLSVLSDDVKVNETLIKKGYTCILDIARTPERRVVNTFRESLGEHETRQMILRATAQVGAFDNLMMNYRAGRANGYQLETPAGVGERLATLVPDPCECSDCESAVSPLAYLADLLNYVASHVYAPDASGDPRHPMTPDSLSSRFHQPFGELPVSCEHLHNSVRQIRLCIEVLRGHLGTIALDDVETKYCETAYEVLLNQIGTSYEELRQARTDSEEEREALAGRLGISVENLRGLTLDPARLDESQLEKLFGLRDTRWAPLEDPSEADLLRWRLDHLHARWDATDWPDPEPDHAPPLIDPDLIGPGDLAQPLTDNPAYERWLERDAEVAATLEGIATGGIANPIEHTTGATLDDLRVLAARLDAEEDVEGDIWAHGFTVSAFRRFMALTELRESGEPMLQSEDEEWRNLLVQALKVHQYRSWRTQEKGMTAMPLPRLTLNPEFFKLRDSLEEVKLIPWRASEADRRAWREKLRTRIEQEETVKQQIQTAVDAAEEAALTQLRDGLIKATDKSAKELTDLLLIDCETGVCQKTTRIAQAIMTIQNLVFSVRMGLFADTPHAGLTLEDDDFEERWQWLGSYATWRAAMFVFIWPENLLLPQLRRWQTPAFRALVRELRENRRLTPEQVRIAAGRYADYFGDVCDLRLKAAVQVSHSDGRRLVHVFAQGGVTETVYVSWYNPDVASYPQSPWEPVPGLENATDVVGASVYDGQIYVFARAQEERMEKLFYTTYNLELSAWTGKVKDLELPEDLEEGASYSAVIEQNDGDSRPHVAVLMPSGAIFTRQIKEDATDWENWRWYFLRKSDLSALLAMINTGDGQFCLIAQTMSGALVCRCRDSYDDGRWHQLAESSALWLGGFCWPQIDDADIYLFWRNSPGAPTDQTHCYMFRTTPVGEMTATQTIDNIGGLRIWLLQISGYDISVPMSEYQIQLGETDTDLWRAASNPAIWRDNVDELRHELEQFVVGLLEESDEWRFTNEQVKQFARTYIRHGMVIERTLETAILHLFNDIWSVRVKHRVARELESLGEFPYEQIADVCGAAFQIVYRSSGPIGVYHTELVREADAALSESMPIQLAPQLEELFDATAYLGESDRSFMRRQIINALDANVEASTSILGYLEEAWYFVPLHIAMQLQRRRQFQAALDWFRSVYDYARPDTETRNIYYGLPLGEFPATDMERAEEWLLDPLNPHAIAMSRGATATQLAPSYTRFTLVSLIRCVLEYADAEFTRDTAESLAQARLLYLAALDLLDLPELKQEAICDRVLKSKIDLDGIESNWKPLFVYQGYRIRSLGDMKTVEAVASEFETIVASTGPVAERYNQVELLIENALAKRPKPPTFDTQLYRRRNKEKDMLAAWLTEDELADRLVQIADRFAGDVGNGSIGSGPDRIGGIVTPMWSTTVVTDFCVPLNPIPQALRTHAELSLYKLRTCRNIAGMERPIEPYAAPTDSFSGLPTISAGGQLVLPVLSAPPPTLYRYVFLIEQAKHLTDRAAQMEAAFLAALEKRDAEYYNLMKAKQDVELARASVHFQDLRIREAEDSVKLAELQKEGAQIRTDHFQALLVEGVSALEMASLQLLGVAVAHHVASSILSVIASALPSGYNLVGIPVFSAQASVSSVASALTSMASAASVQSSILSTLASYERRAQEWNYQKKLATHDIRIGSQQVKLANDQVGIRRHERVISQMQTDFAEATADFLANKFTNVELYDWMSGVLEGVYGFFLQQATTMAKLAEMQLAFERQEPPATMIQADYWESPSDDAMDEGQDRRGLTGSARLLQDIYRLDQYRIETEQRKLQLTKTISLARLAPAEFQRFRETGKMEFGFPLELFDRDFPGHYLRLIKRVRTSVIALIPAVDSIKATLSTTGLSRAVANSNGVFQEVPIRRAPERVALTSPRDATGLFELTPGPQEMLLPFEGMGVATSWELRMPKAANLFDYRTIADVLITIEYTALDSYDYRQQVIRDLDNRISADRPFSFRHQFADQWYDLHNPEQTGNPMVVQFRTRPEDFPPNLEGLSIQHVVLYFARATDTFEVDVMHLLFREQDAREEVGSGARTVDGMISTRGSSDAAWTVFQGDGRPLKPYGEWTLALPEEMENRFKNEEIEDILFVITYSGRTPEWPD